tara:strand:- start:568 stop:1332 length:765 start_codon:yes stop_codon:yes gene_type:complete
MDMDVLKARLNKLQSQTNQKGRIWKPVPGKTQIRIIPYKFNKNDPFIDLYFHYTIGNRTLLSPKSFGRPDPIDEFASKMKSTGDRDDWLQGIKYEPKKRTFVPIIVRGEEDTGIKFWGFGKTVYDELISINADPDYYDITDVLTGRDIVVEHQTAKEVGNQYGKTFIRVKPQQTPITEDKELLENILDDQIEITEIYEELSYDDLKNALRNFLNIGGDTSTQNGVDTEKPKAQMKETVTTTDDVSDAFDKMFNK